MCFSVRFRGLPLTAWKLPDSGVRMGSLLEMREAARFALVPWHEFCALSEDQQGGIIAHYRTITLLKAVETHTTIEEQKLKARPHGTPKGRH